MESEVKSLSNLSQKADGLGAEREQHSEGPVCGHSSVPTARRGSLSPHGEQNPPLGLFKLTLQNSFIPNDYPA